MNPTHPPAPLTASDPQPASRRWLAHIVPAALVVLILWLPFGFALTGLIEEWDVLGLFIKHGVFFFADTSSPLAPHALRPLTIFPHALAFWLDSNSFFYWHVLLMLALVIKGASVSYLMEKLTGSLKLGVIACVLVIIYPADTMQLSFRGVHINWALSLALLGSAIFLHALSLKHKFRACLFSALASALFASACFMYEASLLLACIPALMLFARDGLVTTLRQIRPKLAEHAIWVAGPAAYVIYALRTSAAVKSYQAGVVGTDLLSTLKLTYPKLFSVGLLRSTLGGWFDALRITAEEFANYGYVVAASAVLSVAIMALLRKDKANPAGTRNTSALAFNIRLGLTGLTLILLGYFPFLTSYSHLAISQRTFLFATPGAALLLAAILNGGFSLSKALTRAAIGFFFITGISFQLYQFHHYIEISRTQTAVLSDITRQFDGNSENKTLLILDHGNRLNHNWMFINASLTGALSFLYDKPISNVQVCHLPSKYWQRSDELGRKGRCVEGAQDWTFEYPTPVSGPGFPTSLQPASLVIPKASIVTVEIGKTDETPQDIRTVPKGVAEKRYESLIDSLNAKTRFIRFKDTVTTDRYDWTFGKWWSMEIPTHGAGWRQGEWEVNSFHHQALAWKSERYSSLIFPFKPKDQRTYELKGRFTIFAGKTDRSSMKITLNGQPLALQWSADGTFSATIAQGALKDGDNLLEFDSPTDDSYYGLAARLEGIHIARQP